ncbi:MAG: hypothetical protein ABL903_05105 [Methylococcales bacterium]
MRSAQNWGLQPQELKRRELGLESVEYNDNCQTEKCLDQIAVSIFLVGARGSYKPGATAVDFVIEPECFQFLYAFHIKPVTLPMSLI